MRHFGRNTVDEMRENLSKLGLFRIESDRLGCEITLFGVGGPDAARGDLVAEHKREKSNANAAHAPAGLPLLGMERRHREANRAIRLKATARRHHFDGRWRHRVLRRKDDLTPVYALLVWRIGRRNHSKVPLQNVARVWMRFDERWLLLQ